MTTPQPQLPPIGAKVIVRTDRGRDGQPPIEEHGTVTRHVAGWLAEVEIPGKQEPLLYAREGMTPTACTGSVS